jgi:hypothetical protein
MGHTVCYNKTCLIQGDPQKTGTFEMRSGSNVQLAALRNRNLELQTTSPFSNDGSVERSTACCRHKNVLHVWIFQNFPFFGSPCTKQNLTWKLGYECTYMRKNCKFISSKYTLGGLLGILIFKGLYKSFGVKGLMVLDVTSWGLMTRQKLSDVT